MQAEEKAKEQKSHRERAITAKLHIPYSIILKITK